MWDCLHGHIKPTTNRPARTIDNLAVTELVPDRQLTPAMKSKPVLEAGPVAVHVGSGDVAVVVAGRRPDATGRVS